MLEDGKIIIITKDDSLRRQLYTLLQSKSYSLATVRENNSQGIRMIRRIIPDLLIIDDDLPDLPGFDLAALFDWEELPIILLTKTLKPAMVNKARKNWWFTVLSLPYNDEALLVIIDSLLSMAKGFNSLKKEHAKLKMEESRRKNLYLAKGMLMLKYGMSEDQAHKYLVKESMDSSQSLESLALQLIREGQKK